MKVNNESLCSLCGRTRELTFHHLIPRKFHSNNWFTKRFSKDEMKHRGIDLCSDCHSFIHRQYSNKELGRIYNTKESLLENEKVQKFINWVKKQR